MQVSERIMAMSSVVLMYLLSLSLLCVADRTGTKCQTVSTCVCQSSPGNVIDLTSIANTDGTPRFSGLVDPNGWLYSYNPCQPYSSSPCFANVQGCQTSADGTQAFTIADGGTEEFWLDTDGTPYLYYTGPGNEPGSQTRETKVYFHCDESQTEPYATSDGDASGPILNYILDVYTNKACEQKQSSPAAGGEAGVVGIVLIILVLVGIATYFIVGALIMKFHYNASGTDIVPNKNFWVQFPLLIKDGFVFTFSPCYNLVREKTMGYQKT